MSDRTAHINYIKGTLLRSGRVTHFKRNFSKTCCFFLLLTCVWQRSLFCGTLIYLLSIGNSFKTCYTSVDLGKALVALFHAEQIHSIFKPIAKSIEDILRYHKICFYTLITSVTRKYTGRFSKIFFLSVLLD